MTVQSTAAGRSPKPLPHSRSRGGSDAGSAGQPGRRNPRATGQDAGSDMTEYITAARSVLRAQRGFRIHQLQRLDEACPDPATDPGRSEVHRALREAARSTLRDIEAALHRMQEGTYGSCPRCHGTISIERLRALPMAPLCGRCQHAPAAKEPGADA